MKLYIKERVFAVGSNFTVKDGSFEDRYTVEDQIFSWGKKLRVYDRSNREVAYIHQKITLGMPTYFLEVQGRQIATIRRKFTWFKPHFTVEGLGWEVEGSFWEHEYRITKFGRQIASIYREWMTWGDSYVVDVANEADELAVLAVVLTIDCVAESNRNN